MAEETRPEGSGMPQHDHLATQDAATSRGSLFVRRPVLAVVLNLLIVVAGLAAFSGLEVRELPNIDRPVVTIRTTYTGATPETVDKAVTSVIENAVALTPGIKSISSTSSAGQSRVTIEFDSGVNIDNAANDLRDAVGRVQRRLPDDVDAPTVVKADTDSDAIMRLAVTSSTTSIEDLTQIVEDEVLERLSAVEGVADVQVFGDRAPLVRVIIDPYALAARGLTVGDLQSALATVALDAPAGQISDANRTMLVRADASTKSAEEISAIRLNAGTRVGDVADVIFGPAEKVTSLRINGQTGIGLGIVRQAQSNTLSISEGITEAVHELNDAYKDRGISVFITSNDAVFIEGALEEVIITLVLATAIVVAIIYIFLRSLTVTLIPAITVPIALTGTLAAMYMAGFSINILTLLALVLATGMVVDDAIVVIENIARHRGMGFGQRAAAVLGTRQVFFAVISTTATLAAVFIPVSFMPGTAGRLFSEFGFVLAFSVVLSAVIALTLTPMMASRLIRKEHEEARTPIGKAVAAIGSRAAALYSRLLRAALAAPMIVILAATLFAGGAVVGFSLLPEELTPPEDRGFIPISVSAPQGATVGYMEDQMRQVEAVVRPYIDKGEVTSMFITSGAGGGSSSNGFVLLTLAEWQDRERSQMEITSDLNQHLQTIPGVQIFARSSNSLGVRGGGQGLSFSITGTDYNKIADAADALQAKMEADPHFGAVRINYDTTQPQLSIDIDRERASDLGVPVESITNVLSVLLAGADLGEFYVGDDAITVHAEVPSGMIQDASTLDNIQVRTSAGAMVPLSALVSVRESAVAPSLPRAERQRAIPMSADLADGTDMRSAMTALDTLARSLPVGMGIRYSGEAAQLLETSSGVLTTFAFALLIVLLVLAAQFESFFSAFILLATVPFGLAAAIYVMLLTGNSLNIYTEIGLVMLVGLMSKNGILVVEFADQLREQGQSVQDAIRNACEIRLRPVVMTMISMVLGGLPLVIRSGAGSEARHALGWIVVGGLGLATVATLFLTPVVYSLVARLSRPRSAETQRLNRELAEAAQREARKPVRAMPPADDLPIAAE